MFAKRIIDSDAFLDMPLSAQALYFHLSMRADDDGFVNNPKKIQRMIGASDDDCRILIAKRFILTFDSGIIVIKHWRIHNYIQNDRYTPTDYQNEFSTLEICKDKAYVKCIRDVSALDTQVRVSIGKSKVIDNNPLYPPYEGEEVVENIPDSNVTLTCNSNVTSCNADVTQDETPHKRGRKKIMHFVKPTEEEVWAYCNERRNGINAAEFVAFYESKGWRVGNQPMKDWKAAVRTWEIRKREKNPQMSSAEADKLNERLINLSPDDI